MEGWFEFAKECVPPSILPTEKSNENTIRQAF